MLSVLLSSCVEIVFLSNIAWRYLVYAVSSVEASSSLGTLLEVLFTVVERSLLRSLICLFYFFDMF